MKSSIPYYIKWVAANLAKMDEHEYRDTHVEVPAIAEAEVSLSDVASFLTRVSEPLRDGKHPVSCGVVLIFNLSSFDGDSALEREFVQSGRSGLLKPIDPFTPPNLYIMQNPLHAIFMGTSIVREICCKEEWIFFVRREESEENFDEVLIAMRFFPKA